MAEKYYTLLTQTGQAKIANALAYGQKISFTDFALGDGGGASYDPNENQTELRHEVYRAAVANVIMSDPSINMLEINMAVPADIGGFIVREMGIFDEDGDLIAIAKTPDDPKPTAASGAAKDVVYRMFIIVTNADVVEVKVDPNVTLATKEEVQAVKIDLQKEIDVLSDNLNDELTEISGKIGQSTDPSSVKTIFGGQADLNNGLKTIKNTTDEIAEKINTIYDGFSGYDYRADFHENEYFPYSKNTNFNAIAVTEYYYFSVGKSGVIKKISKSGVQSGTNWDTLTSNTTVDLYEIIHEYESNRLIAVGPGTANQVVVSADNGITWVAKTLPGTVQANPQIAFHTTCQDESYKNHIIIYSPGYKEYFLSTDCGETWTTKQAPVNIKMIRGSYGARFLMVPQSGTGLYYSQNGSSWSTASSNKLDLTKTTFINIYKTSIYILGIATTTASDYGNRNICVLMQTSYIGSTSDFISEVSNLPANVDSGDIKFITRRNYQAYDEDMIIVGGWRSRFSNNKPDFAYQANTTGGFKNKLNLHWNARDWNINIGDFDVIAGQLVYKKGGSVCVQGKNDYYTFDMDDVYCAVKEYRQDQKAPIVLRGQTNVDSFAVRFFFPDGIQKVHVKACAGGSDATTSVSGNGGEILETDIFLGDVVSPFLEAGFKNGDAFIGIGSRQNTSGYGATLSKGGGAAPGKASPFASGGYKYGLAGGGAGFGGGGAPGVNSTSMISYPGDGEGGMGGAPGGAGVGAYSTYYDRAFDANNGGHGGYGAGGGAPYSSSYKPGLGGPPIIVIEY